MKVGKSSALFAAISEPQNDGKLIPYINRFLSVHPYAGVYEVDDSPYVSKVKNRADAHFHPSGDCMKCARLLYFERDESVELVDTSPDPHLQAIFKTGSAVHAMLQAWFAEMDKIDGFPSLVGNEVRIHDEEWNIGGYIDSILVMPGDDEETIIEIKTINSHQFATLAAPKSEHRMQMGCYLMVRSAQKGIVLYMNKDTSEFKEFAVGPMDMMNVLMKWSQVRHAVANGDPSPLGYGCKMGSREWERCPARSFCFRI